MAVVRVRTLYHSTKSKVSASHRVCISYVLMAEWRTMEPVQYACRGIIIKICQPVSEIERIIWPLCPFETERALWLRQNWRTIVCDVLSQRQTQERAHPNEESRHILFRLFNTTCSSKQNLINVVGCSLLCANITIYNRYKLDSILLLISFLFFTSSSASSSFTFFCSQVI